MKRHPGIILLVLAIALPVIVGGEKSVTPGQRAEREREAARTLEQRVLEWARLVPHPPDDGLEFVFDDGWSAPVAIEGEEHPTVEFRNGRIWVVGKQVKFSEGLEATISSHPSTEIEYRFVDGRWRLRAFATVVG